MFASKRNKAANVSRRVRVDYLWQIGLKLYRISGSSIRIVDPAAAKHRTRPIVPIIRGFASEGDDFN